VITFKRTYSNQIFKRGFEWHTVTVLWLPYSLVTGNSMHWYSDSGDSKGLQ